jgi:hypothetical protein
MVKVLRSVALGALAWVLWMDQTVYKLPGETGREGPIAAETASGQYQQLAVVSTKAACEALRKPHVQAAAQRDAARGKSIGYPERFRFFCSPAVDDVGK